jgi:hypothetical protein
MGDIIDYCQGLLIDDNIEGIFVHQKGNDNIRINRRRSDAKLKEQFLPLNTTEENNVSQCVSSTKLKNAARIINSDENNTTNNNKIENAIENELINSVTKMTKIIESLENKNKILENEKNEIKKENLQLLQKIEMYKNTLSNFKNENFKNDNPENINIKEEKSDYKELKGNKEEKIKIIFLFKNNKKINELYKEPRVEIMAYKYEMFIEVKLRLLNLRHLDARDIKSYSHNSKEINDWLTLDELNFLNNTYVTCELS